jgi:oxygen-independent coproporphyrinogen III oxidase
MTPRPAVAMYVHVPFCRSKCRYCAFVSERITATRAEAVVRALVREVRQRAQPDTVETLYLGGGCPTVLPEADLLWLVTTLVESHPRTTEFTVEAHPAQVSEPLLRRLHDAGVNRLSIGAQSFVPGELRRLGRAHTTADVARAVYVARGAGFDNLSLDLIAAVPGSTLADFDHSLRCALDLSPQHMSVYALSYETGTELTRQRDAGLIEPVDEETDRAMTFAAMEILAAAGFEHYEISNFARPGFECRHNLTYWANQPWLGIGPSAASWDGVRRPANVADVDEYLRRIAADREPWDQAAPLGPEEIACETAVLNLRRRRGIDLAEYRRTTGFDAMDLFAEVIAEHIQAGFLACRDGRIFLTTAAVPVADRILCDFAAL